MKLNKACDEVVDAETALARELQDIGNRHAAEHDLGHLSQLLVCQCAERLRQLAPLAQEYGSAAPEPDPTELPHLLGALRRASSRVAGRPEASGQLLLHDLRCLYLAAQRTEIAWEILLQVAMAVRDPRLVELATIGLEESETCGKWLRGRVKKTAPQVLAG